MSRVWPLLSYQARWVQDKTPFKVCEKSRRIGISWAEAYDAVMHCAENVGDVFYQSFSRENIDSFMTDTAQWARDLQRAADAVDETIIDFDDGTSATASRIRFANGRRIIGLTSSPGSSALAAGRATWRSSTRPRSWTTSHRS